MYQKIISTLVVMAIAIFGYLACTGPQSNGLDILILNGKIVNGTGNPWFYGDAGIKDNTIIAIRDLSNQTAALVIDAEGFIVSPGFIDMHTHCDDYGVNLNYLIQGVTTVRTGSCGSGTYKIAETKAAWEELDIGTNAVLLVGNIPVREEVMGDDQQRAPTQTEIEQMQELIRRAMQEGAWGAVHMLS